MSSVHSAANSLSVKEKKAKVFIHVVGFVHMFWLSGELRKRFATWKMQENGCVGVGLGRERTKEGGRERERERVFCTVC